MATQPSILNAKNKYFICAKYFCNKVQLRVTMPKISKKKQSSSDSDSGPDDRNQPPPSKKAKETGKSNKDDNAAAGGNGDGATTWTLEGMRQVRINEFRGKRSVDIREFYEKDGKVLPGKKGISLNGKQWSKLLEVADEITKALNE